MQRHEVQLRGAESWGGGGWGRTARWSRLAALSRPGAPCGRVSRMLRILVAIDRVRRQPPAGDHNAPARARPRPCEFIMKFHRLETCSMRVDEEVARYFPAAQISEIPDDLSKPRHIFGVTGAEQRRKQLKRCAVMTEIWNAADSHAGRRAALDEYAARADADQHVIDRLEMFLGAPFNRLPPTEIEFAMDHLGLTDEHNGVISRAERPPQSQSPRVKSVTTSRPFACSRSRCAKSLSEGSCLGTLRLSRRREGARGELVSGRTWRTMPPSPSMGVDEARSATRSSRRVAFRRQLRSRFRSWTERTS